MNCSALLKQMESLGSAQTRKTYGRHGVQGPMFGVSYKHLGLLKKQLKTDHSLALELWESGNHDARVLATMIADPAQLKSAQIERWLKDADNHVIAEALASLVAKSPLAHAKAEKWRGSKKELTSCAGWAVTSRLALDDPGLKDLELAPLLTVIENQIHAAPNRARYAMNQALIAIGVRNEKLRKLAIASAKRIGKVEVDHGPTACTTPDAAAYIAKTVAHRARRAKC